MTRTALLAKISKAEDSISLARGKRRMTGKRVQSVIEVKAAGRLDALRRQLRQMDLEVQAVVNRTEEI